MLKDQWPQCCWISLGSRTIYLQPRSARRTKNRNLRIRLFNFASLLFIACNSSYPGLKRLRCCSISSKFGLCPPYSVRTSTYIYDPSSFRKLVVPLVSFRNPGVMGGDNGYRLSWEKKGLFSIFGDSYAGGGECPG